MLCRGIFGAEVLEVEVDGLPPSFLFEDELFVEALEPLIVLSRITRRTTDQNDSYTAHKKVQSSWSPRFVGASKKIVSFSFPKAREGLYPVRSLGTMAPFSANHRRSKKK